MYNALSELYNKKFENYLNDYKKLSDIKKDKLDQKFNPANLRLKESMIMMDGLQKNN